jgi:hypothetical protein
VEDLKIVDPKLQWEKIYQTKQLTEVSWYRPRLEVSLQLNEEAAPNLDASIIDVGAGESTLVDDLLARGYRNVYAMDISSTPQLVILRKLAYIDMISSACCALAADTLCAWGELFGMTWCDRRVHVPISARFCGWSLWERIDSDAAGKVA